MAAQGQSYFQASGDDDAYTGSQLLDASSQVNSPVGSTNITAVGGTTLTTTGPGGTYVSETVWNWGYVASAGQYLGSSGGVSTYYRIPWWQAGVDMTANLGSTTMRNAPDVALTADNVFVDYNNGNSGGFGGTSCAAPLWAGFTALVNQQSVTANGTTVGFLNPVLYAIGAGNNYTACFHDITTGNNIGGNTPGLYYAVPGYDLCTGLGTPNGTNLINALVWPPPILLTQPAGRNVTNGANVAFSVTVSGAPPFGYSWLFNGMNLSDGGNISGSASNVLSITSVTTNNAGSYQLVVTNTAGVVTSSVAVLNVGFIPVVFTQPTNLTILSGGSAVFSASANGSTPLVYQWRRNGTNLANGASISGATSNVVTLASVTTNSSGNYNLQVTNLFGAATSSVAVLTVVLPPSIVKSSLTNRTIQCGSNIVTFAVTPSGTPPLNLQWSLDATPVIGATNTSFSVTNLHLPNHTVSVVITNLYGSLASNAVLTVQDTLAPAITLYGANPLYVELGSAFTDPGATAADNCAGAVGVIVSGTVNTGAVGTNTLTYSAGDGNGNTNTATRTVIVRDTTPPAILWSFTNLVAAAGTNCSAVMPDVTGTNFILAADLSGPLAISQIPPNGAILPLGTNTVIIAVSDLYSNTGYSINTIVVQDQTPPVITLNGGSLLFSELGQVFTDPGATADDSCAGLVPVTVSGSVDANAVGTNTLTYIADDGHGNTNMATRTVIVRDTTPPTIVWSFTNLVVAAGTNCSAQMPDVTGTNFILATDLSGPLAFSQIPTNGAIMPLGTNTVIIAVTDLYSNTAYSINTIIVQDQTPPVITLNGGSLLFSELGQAFTDPGATADDSCAGLVPVTVSGSVDANAVGTNTLTYSAGDGNGNTNTATRTVIVRDTTPPAILWSFTNLVVAAGTNCSALMPDVTGTNFILATDLSGPLSFSQVPTNGAILPLGTNTVIIAVSDLYSNTGYSINTIVVQDQTPPVITLNGGSLLFSELGQAFTDPGATADDSCAGLVPVTVSGSVDANAVGTNTLTYSASDGNGNTNTATRTVIVRDTTPPAILWSFTNLVVAAGTNCSALMPDVTGTNFILATDLSGPLSFSQVPTNGAILPLGTNTVIIAVSDLYSNTGYSINTIVVQDQTPPVITLNGGSLLFSELGQDFTDPGATADDSCAGLVPVTVSGSVDANAVGTNTLTYTADDGHGNTNTAMRTVIVRDTTPPTIFWSFTNLVAAAGTNCTAPMPDVTGTNFVLASDLSGPLVISQVPTNGAILPLGTNTVVIAVSDLYGNTTYAINTVIVQDQTPPVFLSQPQSQTNLVGTTAAFSTAAEACTPTEYQWFFNSAILTAQTNSALAIFSVSPTSAGNYSVVTTASGGSTTSAVATLTVNLNSTSLALNSSENPAGYRDDLNFTVAVTPASASGTVQFFTNGFAFDTETLVAGLATSAGLASLPRGTNSVTAIYSGDADDLSATNTLAQIVTNHPPAATDIFYDRLAGYPLDIAVADLATNWSDLDGDTVSLAGISASADGVTVTNNAGTLVYFDTNNVDDQFVCAISDGWGGTNFQTVYIDIVLTNTIPTIIGVGNGSNGGVTLNFGGAPGDTYVLEATTNLISPTGWQPLATNMLGTNGLWQFTDPQVIDFPQRFYRLKLAQ